MKNVLRVWAIITLMIIAILSGARRDFSGDWIVYNSDESGALSIHIMTGDGASSYRLNLARMCPADPKWSPDGKSITFIEFCTRPNQLRRTTPAGTPPESMAVTQMHRWSPDGSRLLLVNTNSELSVMDVSTREEQRLADNIVIAYWSPDGQWLYAYTGPSPQRMLERIHVETGRIEPLIAAYGTYSEPGWSSDGAQIVVALPHERLYWLHITSPDMQTDTRIITRLPARPISNPRWSPDGEWIAFLGGSPPERTLYRIRPDGSDLQQLTDELLDLAIYQWSPDGEWLIFAASIGGQLDIYRARADGSSMQNLTRTDGNDFSPQVAPVSGLGWHPFGVTIVAAGVMILSISVYPKKRKKTL